MRQHEIKTKINYLMGQCGGYLGCKSWKMSLSVWLIKAKRGQGGYFKVKSLWKKGILAGLSPCIWAYFKQFSFKQNKGKILQWGRASRVKSILTTILHFWQPSSKDRTFCLKASFSARREDHFQKKCPKQTFRSDFVKLGSYQKYFIYFWQKNGRLFCLFVAIVFPILADLKKIEALIDLEKADCNKKLFDVQLGNCSTPRVYNTHILQIY